MLLVARPPYILTHLCLPAAAKINDHVLVYVLEKASSENLNETVDPNLLYRSPLKSASKYFEFIL